MTQQANGLATRNNTPAPIIPSTGTANEIAIGSRGVELNSFADVLVFSDAVYRSGLAPKGFQNAAAIAIVIQSGLELGLTAMQSLQGMHSINNKIGLSGELALAIIRRSPACEYIRTSLEGTGDFIVGACVSKRKDDPVERKTTFSVSDAKRAGLWGKEGPWRNYPQRLLMWRAMGFHGKDYWSEVLKGIPLADELRDIPGGDVSKTSKKTQIIDVTTVRTGALAQAKATASDGTEFIVNGQHLIDATTQAMNHRTTVELDIQESPKGNDLLAIVEEPQDRVADAVLISDDVDSMATEPPAPVAQPTLKEKVEVMTLGELLTGFQKHGLPKRVIEMRLNKKVNEFTEENMAMLRSTYLDVVDGKLATESAFIIAE